MTIREIAKIANVSVSTVSKIINKKDENISDETRERVLKIVKECNYVPYANIKTANSNATFLIGVLIDGNSERDGLVKSIAETARKEGYSVIVCVSSDREEEYKNMSVLFSHHVDGILWESLEDPSAENERYLREQNVPYHIIDFNNTPSLESSCLDYIKLGYSATRALVDAKHQQLACLVDADTKRNRRFLKGFQQCLFDGKIPFDAKMYQVWDKEAAEVPFLLHSYTGIVCVDSELAGRVYEEASSRNIKIPKDLSVVSLEDSRCRVYLQPSLSAIILPFEQLGEYVCKRLIDRIENTRQVEAPFQCGLALNHKNSVDVPITLRNKKIVVVGTINMDTLLNLTKFPEMGETVRADNRVMIPGGKGLNQALGAAKLGAEVYLIGKVGKDYDGSVLYDFLKSNNVHVEGVSTDSKMATGHAYVNIETDGESSIVIYEGANRQLSEGDIDRHGSMLEKASFCLLQTEIRQEIVEYAAQAARKHGARVLLKPCAVSRLSDKLLKNVDILLPNKKEINTLLPGEGTYEEKARYFLERGVGTVIITLGHDGCYLRDAQRSAYFEAADVVPVDTTGAADAFAATLAVYLSKSYEIETAVKYATYAAGLSTTRQGVPPSLVDQSTLEMYLSDI